MSFEEQVSCLREQIERATAYYVLDAPEISDAEYDPASPRAPALGADHPELAHQGSTKRTPRLIILPSNGAHASTVHRPPGPSSGRTSGW